MKLHNWCMDKKDSVPLMRELEDQRKGDEWLVITNDSLFRDRPTGDRRKSITQMLDDNGIIRPVLRDNGGEVFIHKVIVLFCYGSCHSPQQQLA